MTEAKHSVMDLGLSRADAILRWRDTRNSAPGGELRSQLAQLGTFIAEMQMLFDLAGMDSVRSDAVARDSLSRLFGDLLRSRDAAAIGLIKADIRRQLRDAARSQMEIWRVLAQQLQSDSSREKATVDLPVHTNARLDDMLPNIAELKHVERPRARTEHST